MTRRRFVGYGEYGWWMSEEGRRKKKDEGGVDTEVEEVPSVRYLKVNSY